MQTEPFSLKAARLAFTSLGAVAPEPMAALAERLYFSPRRHRAPERERAFLEDATAYRVDTPAGSVAAYRWQPLFPWERADRGTVLLVHGWEGRASQLGAFVRPLVEQGFTVVGADAPAHGLSPGDSIDLPRYADVVRAVAEDAGGVRAVVGHSFGCAAAVLAIADGLDVDAAVLVAPPASLDRFATEFARMVGLTKATEAIFRARLEERFGKEWWRTYALDTRVRSLDDVAALVVHDAGDAEIPVAEAEALANAWPGAELVVTEGLGHRRILRDDAVVDGAARFLHERV
jgi:predicted alpha/beta hydrolase family esterase